MARNRLTDFMQSHRFWLFDVVPSLAPPFYVLGTPFFGFSNITAPEYTAEVSEIKQLNSMFKRYAYDGGSVGPITLTRGIRGYDDTMWDWMYRALIGLEVTQRHLLLLQFTNINMNRLGAGEDAKFIGYDIPGIDTPLEFGMYLPGRAYLLWSCIPTRYKTAGDFDATSSEVSLQELEIQPEAISVFTLLDPI